VAIVSSSYGNTIYTKLEVSFQTILSDHWA
jgi:hypothetical protein